jgi:hypothetical protein
LYKPSIAAPFALLLLVRREWRALAVVAGCAVVWYLLSVPASGGDWAWPKQYAVSIGAYYTPDFLSNAANAVSLPGVLIRFGISAAVAAGVGVAAFVVCLPCLARIDSVAALSVTSALAVAVSPHAWHYEPVILVPAIFYAMRSVREPMRTLSIVAAYVVADVSIFDIRWLTWNVLAAVVLFWTVLVVLSANSGSAHSQGRLDALDEAR